jgi:hypothetical protein
MIIPLTGTMILFTTYSSLLIVLRLSSCPLFTLTRRMSSCGAMIKHAITLLKVVMLLYKCRRLMMTEGPPLVLRTFIYGKKFGTSTPSLVIKCYCGALLTTLYLFEMNLEKEEPLAIFFSPDVTVNWKLPLTCLCSAPCLKRFGSVLRYQFIYLDYLIKVFQSGLLKL